MKHCPDLVRRYVLLAIDICRFVAWLYVVLDLITNYLLKGGGLNAKLQKSAAPG